MDKKARKFRDFLANKDIIANAPPFTEADAQKLKTKVKK
jgi:hypothetical protein